MNEPARRTGPTSLRTLRVWSGSWLPALLLCLSGCAKPLYYWGGYEDCLHAAYCMDDPEKAYALLSETVKNADSKNLPLAPGLYAEYGFLLYQRGDAGGAVAYFRKEAEHFPESAPLMNGLIGRLRIPSAPSKDRGDPGKNAPATGDDDSSGGER